VAEAFDHIVVSAEVGLIKPDPRIYRLALDGLGVSSEEAVFVDDMAENITGAEAVGMRGVRFLNPDQAMADVWQLLRSPSRRDVEPRV
jgi:putative hydrolase of the HAD superfamily